MALSTARVKPRLIVPLLTSLRVEAALTPPSPPSKKKKLTYTRACALLRPGHLQVWDIRKGEVSYTMTGHAGVVGSVVAKSRPIAAAQWTASCSPLILPRVSLSADTVTGLELSPDGRNIVSNAMDNTVRGLAGCKLGPPSPRSMSPVFTLIVVAPPTPMEVICPLHR